MTSSAAPYFDVVIVGAGLSGVGAACHLMRECPNFTFTVLESRNRIGGTWDLFRYPRVRSDSDMYTLGYEFSPWLAKKSIADGSDILSYIQDTSDRFDVTSRITFERRVIRAEWSSDVARWRLTVQHGDSEELSTVECNFLWGNTGYYRYDQGFRPSFQGEENFAGQFIHPQFWPDDYVGSEKNIVVIGSGATAMTLVPALAADAKKVVLLQRSPTYVASRPDTDRVAQWLMRRMSDRWAYRIIRYKNVLGSTLIYQLSRRRPSAVRAKLQQAVRDSLPPGFDVDTHFSPRYDPWDQRLCLITNGDLFERISTGSVEMVTDTIDHFEHDGLVLTSGRRIPADIVVTATGLELQFLGGMELVVDGAPIRLSEKIAYKGIMVCDVPNLAMTFGYTNASWTLKADLTARYVGRVLRAMRRRGADIVIPRPPTDGVSDEPYIALSAGYITRGASQLPQQGLRRPWKIYQNYFLDFWLFRLRRIDDSLDFSRAGDKVARGTNVR